MQPEDRKIHGELLRFAISQGADDAKIISAQEVPVKEEFVRHCESCGGFGKSAHCPPHAMKSSAFKNILRQHSHVLIFKTNVPTEMLLTHKRHKFIRKLHLMAAQTELFARSRGFPRARGLAGGSCKPLFCGEHEGCRILENRDASGNKDKNGCRHPDSARTSMSAFGIDIFQMAEKAGWEMQRITCSTRSEDVPTGMLIGMVLL